MRRALFLAASLLLIPSAAARAGCTVTTLPVVFSTYLPFSSAPSDTTASVTVNCIAFTGVYTIALIGGSATNRRMNGPGSGLPYQLFTDATRTTVWGDGTGGSTVVVDKCPPDCNTVRTVYARIPARQTAHPGSYTDTIVVMVKF